MSKKINFKNNYRNYGEVEVFKSFYGTDPNVAAYICMADGNPEPVTILSVNLADYGLYPAGPNNFFIKDFSEGEGVAEDLQEQGVVEIVRKVTLNEDWGNYAYEVKWVDATDIEKLSVSGS